MAVRALELFQETRYQGPGPDVFTYSALISVGAKGQKLERALELF